MNEEVCIDCGLCEKVCPVINKGESKVPLKVYAAINTDQVVRSCSSSGGIFYAIGEEVINSGGVVFAAKFDSNWEVVHSYTESIDGLAVFRGSKYVQSKIGSTFKHVKEQLIKGRLVLFTGTPCQIAGLKKYLRKDYDNLFTIDIVCHGAPSPLVWRTYLNELLFHLDASIEASNKKYVVSKISFRDKKTGWKQYGFSVYGKHISTITESNSRCSDDDVILFYEASKDNLFMNLFTKNLCLRPSCYQCPAKEGKSESDLTLADYWGISGYLPDWDDDKGTSLIMLHTEKGNKFLKMLRNVKIKETSYHMALAGNPSIDRSVEESDYVQIFWEYFTRSRFMQMPSLLKRIRPSFKQRFKEKLFPFIRCIIPRKILVFIKLSLKK